MWREFTLFGGNKEKRILIEYRSADEPFYDSIQKDYPNGYKGSVHECHTDPTYPAAFILGKEKLLLNTKVVAVKEDNA